MNESKTMNRLISGLLPYAVLGVALAAPLAPRAEPFSVGPKYTPRDPAPAVLLGAGPETVDTSTAPAAAWWGVFEDPVLDGLIKRSLDGNLDLKAAQAGDLMLQVQPYGAKAPEPATLRLYAPVGRFDGFVLHAGDWMTPELLDELTVRAKRLVGCWGNNDGCNLSSP